MLLVPSLTADEAATGTILVIYTETSTDNQRPHSEYVQALRTELETAGMLMPDAWMNFTGQASHAAGAPEAGRNALKAAATAATGTR